MIEIEEEDKMGQSTKSGAMQFGTIQSSSISGQQSNLDKSQEEQVLCLTPVKLHLPPK